MNCLFHILINLHAPSRRIMQGLKTTAKLGTGGILIKKSSRFPSRRHLHGGRQRFHGIACSIYVLLNLHAPSRRIMQGGSQTSLKSSAHWGYVVRLQSQIKHTITICKVLYMRRFCQTSFQNFFCHLTWEKSTRIPQHHSVNKFLFNKPLMPSRERH